MHLSLISSWPNSNCPIRRYHGYVPTHEAFFYCFDSVPLFLAIGLYAFVWPPAYTHQEQSGALYAKATGSSYQLNGAPYEQQAARYGQSGV